MPSFLAATRCIALLYDITSKNIYFNIARKDRFAKGRQWDIIPPT